MITSPLEVAQALDRSDTDLWTAWFHAVQSIPTNPYGIEIHRFGSATVLFTDAIPLSYYNRCMGLGPIASLAGGATVFTLRGRGVQSALLRYRIEQARAVGATLVVSRCRANSSSQRNMERAGLKTAYTKVVCEQTLE